MCTICQQGDGERLTLIRASCYCLVHLECAMSFVESRLALAIPQSCNGRQRTSTCPNPAMHDTRRDVFWPRLLEQVNTAIQGRFYDESGGEALGVRVLAAHRRLQWLDREEARLAESRSTERMRLGGVISSAEAAGASSCSYCHNGFGPSPHEEGQVPVPIPCGHNGFVHANCLRDRASRMAHGSADPQTCAPCSQEGSNGRRPPHPVELVEHGLLPEAAGRWEV